MAGQPRPVVPLPIGVVIVAAGGALGASARAILLQVWPAASNSFPWTVFAINVLGSALLASLPLFAIVRQIKWLPLFLGTGVLGGFTTMSTAAVESYDLRNHAVIGVAYVLGTLGAALVTVAAVDRLAWPPFRILIEAEEGDE